jgi:MFS transporter, SIT family, siderophore-iron:H+ symporter
MSTPTDTARESASPDRSYVNEKGQEQLPRTDRRALQVLGAKSTGVARVEAMASVLTTKDRILLFLGAFLISYAYGELMSCLIR